MHHHHHTTPTIARLKFDQDSLVLLPQVDFISAFWAISMFSAVITAYSNFINNLRDCRTWKTPQFDFDSNNYDLALRIYSKQFCESPEDLSTEADRCSHTENWLQKLCEHLCFSLKRNQIFKITYAQILFSAYFRVNMKHRNFVELFPTFWTQKKYF